MRIVQHKHKEEKHEGSPPKVSEDGEEIADETKSVKEKSVNYYFRFFFDCLNFLIFLSSL